MMQPIPQMAVPDPRRLARSRRNRRTPSGHGPHSAAGVPASDGPGGAALRGMILV